MRKTGFNRTGATINSRNEALYKREAVQKQIAGISPAIMPVRAANTLMPQNHVSGFPNLSQGTPDIRDPLWNPESMYLPRSLGMYNLWLRHYDQFHPILGNAIDLHAAFPMSDWDIQGVDDPGIKDFYEYIKEERIHAYNWQLQANREYQLIGEEYSYFPWNSKDGLFESPVILNPDLLDVFPFDLDGERKYIIDMDIPPQFKELWAKSMSGDPRYVALWQSLDPIIRNCVQAGRKIPLSPNNVQAMQRLAAPYHSRGTSQCIRLIKDLSYEDKLREAQMAVADGHICPVHLWKIGDPNGTYIPNSDELQQWATYIAQGEHQNYYRFVTHQFVNFESKSPTEGLLNITPELDMIHKRMMIGLFVDEGMISGQSPTYAGGVVAYKILEKRYVNVRIRFERTYKDLFRKIAKAHGFIKRTPAEISHKIYVKRNDYIVPEIGWREEFSFDRDNTLLEHIVNLAAVHKVSYNTVCEHMGLDYNQEQEQILKEMSSSFSDGIYDARVQQLVELMGGKGGKTGQSGMLKSDMPGGGLAVAPKTNGGEMEGTPATTPEASNMETPTPVGGGEGAAL